MKKLLTLSFITICYFCVGQQLYEYRNGYLKGFRKGCNCSNNPSNSNNLYNNYGSYNDGYNAGFTDGRIFLNKNSSNQENQLYYEPDYNLLYNALKTKQDLLDKRRAKLQNEYEKIINMIFNIVKNRNDKTLTENEGNIIKEFKDKLNVYINYDLSNTSTYNQTLNWLQDWKLYFMKW